MELHSLRLKPGQDLRKSLVSYAKENNIKAGSIVTCVGALSSAILRMAGAQPGKECIKKFEDNYEIVSLVGTVTGEDCHLHISISDKEGNVIGGHLKEGSIVDITAEVVITEHLGATYLRELDQDTGFEELVVKA